MRGAAGKLRIACPNPDVGPKGHHAFRVELKDGHNYALDLTAAQFGLRQVVMPWDEYCNILDLEALTYFPCGKSESNDLRLRAVYKSRLAPGKPIPVSSEHYTNIIMVVQNNATSCLYSAISAWVSEPVPLSVVFWRIASPENFYAMQIQLSSSSALTWTFRR